MENHNTQLVSESEEMYLLTLALLAEDGVTAPVPLAALAQARAIQPVSVNQMVRKLADAGLVTYFPYKGVALTDEGQSIATRVLRSRRLWEVFLVERLGMPAAEADSLACRLEHLTSDDVAGRLACFLDDPQVSPQGKPIPRHDTRPERAAWLRLGQTQLETPAQVMQVDADPVTRAFLANEGLRPGSVVRVIAAGARGALLLEVSGRSVRLAPGVAAHILVLPSPDYEPAHAGARSPLV
ncbi:MAG: metal-dependent transcriptional regulator [Chloroflexales bacterium]|nr:metal-dependent transcriptional regulator [Chloroflexales bacterium]